MNNGGERRKTGAPSSNRLKDRDEDLVMFHEMHKRDKTRVISLLQPVSDDFEPNGNYPIYGKGMASAKKGPGFLAEIEKNDYDWLKTPPATPLFPSLEMETRNNYELVVQRELPIIQPLSRFAGKPEEKETKQQNIVANAVKPKTPNPKSRIPIRSVTPNARSTSLFTDNKKNVKTTPVPLVEKGARFNLSATNNSKNIQIMSSSSKTTQKTSHVTQIHSNLSNETPPNLRTDRSTSASRPRPVSQSYIQNAEVSNMRGKRQSCSPSVARGRKVAPNSEENTNTPTARNGFSSRMLQTGNGGQLLGSRMVDKIMNARKSSIADKKLNGSMDMESKRDSGYSRQLGTSLGKKSSSTTYASGSRSNGGNARVL